MKWNDITLKTPGDLIDEFGKEIWCHVDHAILITLYMPATQWAWRMKEINGLDADEVE